MATVLFSIAIFAVVVLAMSIGVIAGRRPIQGSCGGLNKDGAGTCGLCGGERSKCEENVRRKPDQAAPKS